MLMRIDAKAVPTSTPSVTVTATVPTSATTLTSATAPIATAPTPRAAVSTSVAGRLVPTPGALHAVKIAGRDVEVILPLGTSLPRYLELLNKSGVFTEQQAELDTLATLTSSSAPTATSSSSAADCRPVVGIILSEPKMLVPGQHKNTETLLILVEAMGCRAVLIPPCADIAVHGGPTVRQRVIGAMAAQLDGLVGPGGADVDPSIYGEDNTHSLHTNVLRDRFEADFVKTALDADLFGFGICRSHQLWNAAAGGSLIQDVELEAVVGVSHKQGHHPVIVKKKSMLYEEVRQHALHVNSLHHQAVDFAGWGFRVTAHNHDEHTGRDMIEATERWNGITTQFHPELMQDEGPHRTLFATLGRRAHVFAALKNMGAPTLRELLTHMKSDERYVASDVDWVKRELGRRLAP